MAIETPPTKVTPPPAPDRNTQQGNTYSNAARTWSFALPSVGDYYEAVSDNVHNNALEAEGFATTASAQAVIAANQATIATTQATNSAASATLAEQWATSEVEVSGGFKGARGYAIDASNSAASASAEFTANSSTSILIELGSKAFSIETGKAFIEGQTLRIVSDANINNYLIGAITNATDGSLTVDVSETGGSGTYSDWKISVYAVSKADFDTKADSENPVFTGEASFDGSVGLAGQALLSQGAGLPAVWGGVDAIKHYEEFTTSGTLTVDPLWSVVYVELLGGGAGGGNNTGSGGVGSGGSGGEFIGGFIDSSELSASESVVIGAGGLGGASGGNNNGSNGGDTTFAGLVARGGFGGSNANQYASLISLALGSDISTNKVNGGTYHYGYGAGATTGVGGQSSHGGGGGGGSSSSSAGGVSQFAGNGGQGNNVALTKAGNGEYPSGGGGGSQNDGGGGDGADGRFRIWAW